MTKSTNPKIPAATDEQITLYSPEYGDISESIELNEITHELLQNNTWKEQQYLLRIYDNKFLNVNKKLGKATKSFNIHLTFLDPKPLRKLIIQFRYMLYTALFASLAWLVLYLMQLDIELFKSPYMYSLVVLPATVGAILFVYMIKQSKYVLRFYSHHGRAPVVELLINNPRKPLFKAFVTELTNCIHESKSRNYYNESQILAAELSEHRRLRDENVLTNAEYEKAKANIFSLHSHRK